MEIADLSFGTHGQDAHLLIAEAYELNHEQLEDLVVAAKEMGRTLVVAATIDGMSIWLHPSEASAKRYSCVP